MNRIKPIFVALIILSLLTATVNALTSTGVTDTAGTPPPADTTPPAEVTNLQHSNITRNSITWSWTNPSDNDFIRTNVTVSKGGVPISGYDHKQIPATPGSTTTEIVSGLEPGTNYTILVQTEDDPGDDV